MCNVDGSGGIRIVKEARDAVYDALIRNDITVVKFTGTVWAQGFLPQLT